MAEEQRKFDYPTEVIDLPSEGKLYSKKSPLSSGKIDVKYMTAKEEDILTSQNLIKKGVVITKLLDSLIVTPGVKSDDLVLGDKNAVMVAARILAYGPEYTCEVSNPTTGETFTNTFNLTDCPFKKLPKGIEDNDFEIELPISKKKINFKLLTGSDENSINNDLKNVSKLGSPISPELTTRLRHIITAVDGEDSIQVISSFVDSMLSRDSLYLRQEIKRISPDIDMEQEVDIQGDTVKVVIPMTASFFWPDVEG